MKIDGYIPADEGVALEQGVDFSYDLGKRIGAIHIRSRILNDANPPFTAAFRAYNEWHARQKQLVGRDDEFGDEADRRFWGLIHDHGVIDWSTTIKSNEKPIQPTRDNFIALMSSRPCRKAGLVYWREAADEYNFRAKSREDDAKN